MTRHTKKSQTETQATGRSLDIFAAAQPKLNQNVVDTAQNNQLDASMFVQFTQKRDALTESIATSERAFGRESSAILNQNESLQGDIDKAFNNPFHDLLAAFSDERSTDELLQEQRRLSVRLSRINSDNVSATANIKGQISAADQKFKDQIGLTELLNKGADRQVKDLQNLTDADKAQTDLATSKIGKLGFQELRAELQNPNTIFPAGLLEADFNARLNDLTLAQTNKLKLKFGGKLPTKSDILGGLSRDMVVDAVKRMKALGKTTVTIEGVTIPESDLLTDISKKDSAIKRDISVFNTQATNAMMATTLVPDAKEFLNSIGMDSLSIETQAQLSGAAVAIESNETVREGIEAKLANGEKLTTADSVALESSNRQAREASANAKNLAATEKAVSLSSDEATQKSLKKYYMANGTFNSSEDAETVGVNLLTASTPESVGATSGAFQKVTTEFAELVQDRMDSNFDNQFKPSDNRTPTNRTGNAKGKINIEDFLKDTPANKKLASVEWLRALRTKQTDVNGQPIDSTTGIETNKWKTDIVGTVSAIQMDMGVARYVESDFAIQNDKIASLLTTSGGGLKSEFKNSTDTLKSIVAALADLTAKDRVSGKIQDDVDYAADFIREMQSEAILSIGMNAFRQPDPFKDAMFRGLFGNKSANEIGAGYTQKYTDKLKSMDTASLVRDAMLPLLDTSEQGGQLNDLVPQGVADFFNNKSDILGRKIN